MPNYKLNISLVRLKGMVFGALDCFATKECRIFYLVQSSFFFGLNMFTIAKSLLSTLPQKRDNKE